MKEQSSIEDIIKSIKNVILGKNSTNVFSQAKEEVLELKNMAEEQKEDREEKEEDKENLESVLLLDQDTLLSEKSSKETLESVKKLANVANKIYNTNSNYRPGGKTIEQLVTEIMKPQLAKWLDDNLPGIIQKLVEKELRRLIPDEILDIHD